MNNFRPIEPIKFPTLEAWDNAVSLYGATLFKHCVSLTKMPELPKDFNMSPEEFLAAHERLKKQVWFPKNLTSM